MGILLSAVRNYRRAVPLMRDERVPLSLKAGAIVLALLIISPLDVFGDIPVLGLFDDAVLLTLLCSLFVWMASQHAMKTMKNVTPGGVPMIRHRQ